MSQVWIEGLYYVTTQRRWKCKTKHSKQQFPVKLGTIFEDSPIGLDKWLPAMWMAVGRNGVSSYEIHCALGGHTRSAWFMLHRIREVTQVKTTPLMTGRVEADETFIAGKIQNMQL